jgi:hypothetical protein
MPCSIFLSTLMFNLRPSGLREGHPGLLESLRFQSRPPLLPALVRQADVALEEEFGPLYQAALGYFAPGATNQ